MMIVEWFVLRAARGARSTKNFGGIREVKITAQKSMQLPSTSFGPILTHPKSHEKKGKPRPQQ
jgi:hypothetical protein